MKTLDDWAVVATSGLSLVRFLEQNLDDKELAVVIDGWVNWAVANYAGADPDGRVANVFNKYTKSLLSGLGTQDGKALQGWERVVDVFRNLQYHLGET